jgi:hypothetical protein
MGIGIGGRTIEFLIASKNAWNSIKMVYIGRIGYTGIRIGYFFISEFIFKDYRIGKLFIRGSKVES